ncbi:phage holin family protein [Enterobacter asburiae]|uniref:phage holin family protein n=1 Tax=Scandinavium sp. UTDF21-P1B TaxID=3446379 RepID=UPI00348AF13C
MTSHDLLLIAKALICLGIAIRVMSFQRNGSRHRWWGGLLAYILIVASATITIQTAYSIFTHRHISAEIPEVVIYGVLLAAVLKTRGNVVQIFKISRS